MSQEGYHFSCVRDTDSSELYTELERMGQRSYDEILDTNSRTEITQLIINSASNLK